MPSIRGESILTGVTLHRLFGVVLAVLAVTATAASAGRMGAADLDKLALRASQLGPGYKLLHRSDGRGADGFVTLDLCGYRFTSEARRTGRLQVNYDRPGAVIKYSNEVVSYAPGGTRLALRELNQAVNRCPAKPVPSTVQGVPPLTYRITRLSTAGLLPGALALRINVSGVYKGKRLSATDAAIYQVHGNVLSGLYVYGGSVVERERAALRAAKQSRANLIR
jgi:hypothetical protein